MYMKHTLKLLLYQPDICNYTNGQQNSPSLHNTHTHTNTHSPSFGSIESLCSLRSITSCSTLLTFDPLVAKPPPQALHKISRETADHSNGGSGADCSIAISPCLLSAPCSQEVLDLPSCRTAPSLPDTHCHQRYPSPPCRHGNQVVQGDLVHQYLPDRNKRNRSPNKSSHRMFAVTQPTESILQALYDTDPGTCMHSRVAKEAASVF